MSALQTEIEARLAGVEPEVEVLLAEVTSPPTPGPPTLTLRLFIDHPAGVTLDLCARVTRHLTDYRDRFSLEVSSPGQDRPLTKHQHYTRYLGRRARVRLREAGGRDRVHKQPAPPPKVVVGELVGASERDVTIAAGDGIVTIPYEQIVRSNLVPGD